MLARQTTKCAPTVARNAYETKKYVVHLLYERCFNAMRKAEARGGSASLDKISKNKNERGRWESAWWEFMPHHMAFVGVTES